MSTRSSQTLRKSKRCKTGERKHKGKCCPKSKKFRCKAGTRRKKGRCVRPGAGTFGYTF